MLEYIYAFHIRTQFKLKLSLYLKKAGLASRNIVHPQKRSFYVVSTSAFIFYNLSGVWWLNVFIIVCNCCQNHLKLMRRPTRNFNIPPPPFQAKPGISAFGDGIVQIPALSGQNSVQMPYPIVEFVCQMPSSAPLVTNKACI